MSENIFSSKKSPFNGNFVEDFLWLNTSFDASDVLANLLDAEAEYAPLSMESIQNIQRGGFCGRWRVSIAKWMFKLADFVRYNREMASVALSILDRYLSMKSVDSREFRLTAMSAFYISSKATCKKHVPVKWLCKRSKQDEFIPSDVFSKETQLLTILNWRLHPPTPQTFIRILAQQVSLSPKHMKYFLNEAFYFAELSACEYQFFSILPSQIALISVIESIHRHPSLSSRTKRSASRHLQNCYDINTKSILPFRKMLLHIFAVSTQRTKLSKKEAKIKGTSPNTVSHQFSECSWQIEGVNVSPINTKRKRLSTYYNTDDEVDHKRQSS